MSRGTRLLARAALLSAAGGLAGLAGGLAGVVALSKAAESAERRMVAATGRAMALAVRVGLEDEVKS